MVFYKSIYKDIKRFFSAYFVKPGKWWDYLLYILAILTFLSVKKDLNLWLIRTIGDNLTIFFIYISGNHFLLWILVIAYAIGVAYVCSRAIKDYYRSISHLLLISFALIALMISKSYWEYVAICWKITIFHLLLFGLAAIAVSILIVVPKNKSRNKTAEINTNSRNCFTIDKVKASTESADKNRLEYAKHLVRSILNTNMDEEALSVGISGGWGSGKSTFLEMLKRAFEEDSSNRVSVVIEFHPWDGASSGQIVSDFFNL